MASVLATRLLIFATPFVVYFIWRWVARRSGREMGSTPWAWLAAAGAAFAALSLFSGAFWYRGHHDEIYVAPQTQSDGRIAPGHFEKAHP